MSIKYMEHRMAKRTEWNTVLALPISADRDHIRGPQNAPVTLLEYGDYQCPYCGAAHPIVDAVQRELGDDMRFVFRHFPLTTMHPFAELAAEAAEAAAAQGSFWQMHDTLYVNQTRLEPSALLVYAEAIGLDVQRFTLDLQTHSHAPKVREDFLSGVRSGVNGTPSFFINGRRHDGAWDYEDLLAAVQQTVVAARRAA
jgi:protein-disulfide isomerase